MKIRDMKVENIYSLCVFNEQSSLASFMVCVTNMVTRGDSTWWGILSSFYWACDYLSLLGFEWATMLPTITSRAVQVFGIMMPCHGFVCRSDHPAAVKYSWKLRVKQTVPRYDKNTINIMTSSNGNIFRVTGPLCAEFTGPWWMPITKASDADLWCFLWSASE